MTALLPDDPVAPSEPGAGVDRTCVLVAAVASAAAGLVHAAAAGSHNGDRAVSLLFAATAAAQLIWAALAAHRPGRALVATGLTLNAVTILAWVLAHTAGLPIVAPHGAESVGVQDLLSALLGAFAAGGAGAALILGSRPGAPARAVPALAPVAVAGVLALALAVPAMAAPHTHGAGDDHGNVVAAGDDHAGDDHGGADHHSGGAQTVDVPGAAGHAGMDHGSGRRITSLDDPGLTPQQRSRARDLLDRTTRAMARFPDEASVVAAGYESIGDSSSGVEHFVNHTYDRDGREIDPDRIEAIVLDTKPGQPKRVAAAMYILEEPKRMGDEPEIAGSLTTWHLHEDLCWDPAGKHVVGVFRLNRCIPGGELKVTPPMLHVWLEPQPCGPFAEAELVENPVDRVLNRGSTTTRPPGADPCQHVHGGH
jgi:hypothetical protein